MGNGRGLRSETPAANVHPRDGPGFAWREMVQALPGVKWSRLCLAWGIITRTDGGGKHAERCLHPGGAAPGSEPRQGRARRAGVTTMGGGWVKIKNKLIDSVFSAVRAAGPSGRCARPRGGCGAEALPAAETAEAEQGQRSAFCKGAATPAAKTGHRNPEGRGPSYCPLALSRFLRRGAAPACKNRSAAPNTAPCFVHRTRSLCLPNGL